MNVEVEVIGNVAETTMTMWFRNDSDRVLEGELVFPLQVDQTVSSYALEIEGEMREGVVVEKQRARIIFEDIVRQGITPGLVEWTKGETSERGFTRSLSSGQSGSGLDIRKCFENRTKASGIVFHLVLWTSSLAFRSRF